MMCAFLLRHLGSSGHYHHFFEGSGRSGCPHCTLDRREVLPRGLDSRKNGLTCRECHAFPSTSDYLSSLLTHPRRTTSRWPAPSRTSASSLANVLSFLSASETVPRLATRPSRPSETTKSARGLAIATLCVLGVLGVMIGSRMWKGSRDTHDK